MPDADRVEKREKFSVLAILAPIVALIGVAAIALYTRSDGALPYLLALPIGLILSIVAINVTRQRPTRGRWLAVIGVILSGSGILVVVVTFALFLFAFITNPP